jgi:hypothetical protein
MIELTKNTSEEHLKDQTGEDRGCYLEKVEGVGSSAEASSDSWSTTVISEVEEVELLVILAASCFWTFFKIFQLMSRCLILK